MKKQNSDKMTAILASIAALVAIFGLGVIFAISSQKPKEKKYTIQDLMSDTEKMKEAGERGSVLSMIKLVASKSEVGGDNTIAKTWIDDLEKVIKKYDKKANWFSKNTGLFYINDIESQKKETLQISDGENCATIELKNEYTISGYSFKPEKCGKHVVMSLTKEEIDKLPKSMKE